MCFLFTVNNPKTGFFVQIRAQDAKFIPFFLAPLCKRPERGQLI